MTLLVCPCQNWATATQATTGVQERRYCSRKLQFVVYWANDPVKIRQAGITYKTIASRAGIHETCLHKKTDLKAHSQKDQF
jgi:hypothetical protein